MKKLYQVFFSLFSIISLFSCNQDIDNFDNGENYIYFNMPFVQDQYGRDTKTRMDSISYSFAMDDYTIKEYTFKIPINIAGLAAPHDRNYVVEVIADSTTATQEEWDPSSIRNTVIQGGNLRDTLCITVKRSKILQTEWRHIVFRLLPNSNFQLGDRALLTAKISFSDILTPPSWWSKWLGTFGEFSREKFVKWQEIYYLGADPNVETIGGPGMGKPLYWDNMPYYVHSGWYPSTFMFIRVLKQYFIDNEVYPDGDTTKPRISLP